MPKNTTRWDYASRNFRIPINLQSDYSAIGCFSLLIFFNLKPLENGSKNAEKYHKMGLQKPKFPNTENLRSDYAAIGSFQYFLTLNPWKTGAKMSKNTTRWDYKS